MHTILKLQTSAPLIAFILCIGKQQNQTLCLHLPGGQVLQSEGKWQLLFVRAHPRGQRHGN